MKKTIELHIFITCLTSREHPLDGIKKILPFIKQTVTGKPDNLFFGEGGVPEILVKYYLEQNEQYVIPMKVDGNVMCDSGQYFEETRNFWKYIKDEPKKVPSEFFKNFINTLVNIGRQALDSPSLDVIEIENQQNIKIDNNIEWKIILYPHWGGESELATQNLKQHIQNSRMQEMVVGITDIEVIPYSCELSTENEIWENILDSTIFENFKTHFYKPIEKSELFESVEKEFFEKAELDNIESDLDWDDDINDSWKNIIETKKGEPIYPLPKRHKIPSTEKKQPLFQAPRAKISRTWIGGRTLRVKFVDLFDEKKEQLFVSLKDSNNYKLWEKCKELICNEINQKLENIELVEAEDDPNLIIAFARMQYFNISQVYDKLSVRRSFRIDNEDAISRDEHMSFDYLPVVTIGLMNVMTYYHDRRTRDLDAKFEYIENAWEIYRLLQLDNRFRFFDSSIWFQYVAVTKRFVRDLKMAIHNVHYNWENGIYRTVEAMESLEFKLRLLRNSYVINFAERPSGPIVTPFVFHPESRMRRLAMKEQASILDVKWKLLFIDDLADKPLNYSKVFEKGETKKTKQGLIEDCIAGKHLPKEYRSFPAYENTQKIKAANIDLICVENINQGYSKITAQGKDEQDVIEEYDLILLNYLFDFDSQKGEYEVNKNKVKYGFHLLQNINAWTIANEENETLYEEMLQRLGPTEKLYFLPVSTYDGAMEGKLHDLGIPLSHNYWEIGAGVDPITTPQLFRYRLFYLLRKQLENFVFFQREIVISKKEEIQESIQNGFYDKAHLRTYQKESAPQSLLLKYVARIVEAYDSNNARDLQYETLKLFPKIVELGARFKKLIAHKEKSKLAKGILENYFFNFDQFAWDHFQHFFYLITYGTFQQKQEMWEEYIFLLQIIEQKQKGLKLKDKRNFQSFKQFKEKLASIADYISRLGTYNK